MPRELTCEHCGEPFTCRPSRARRFCSLPCSWAARGPRLAFWDQVDKSGGPDACWPWIGRSRHPFGYGMVRVATKTVVASRRAYELVAGPVPDGLVVRHRCDNPPCCNPAHLEVGTVAENNADARARGRSRTPTEEQAAA